MAVKSPVNFPNLCLPSSARPLAPGGRVPVQRASSRSSSWPEGGRIDRQGSSQQEASRIVTPPVRVQESGRTAGGTGTPGPTIRKRVTYFIIKSLQMNTAVQWGGERPWERQTEPGSASLTLGASVALNSLGTIRRLVSVPARGEQSTKPRRRSDERMANTVPGV